MDSEEVARRLLEKLERYKDSLQRVATGSKLAIHQTDFELWASGELDELVKIEFLNSQVTFDVLSRVINDISVDVIGSSDTL